MHTPRRSSSAHYGCVRHALRFLLRAFNTPAAACKHISLLLRTELLEMAQHDLGFVQYVSPAERSILHIACRQLAYKAAKASSTDGSTGTTRGEAAGGEAARGGVPVEDAAGSSSSDAPLPAADLAQPYLAIGEITQIRERIERLRTTLKSVPGAAPTSTAPPPLILSEADMHLGRPSLSLLLGEGEGGRLLLPPQAAAPDASPAVADAPPSPAGGGARSAVAEAWTLEASGEISAQERQRRIAATYQQSPAPGVSDQVCLQSHTCTHVHAARA